MVTYLRTASNGVSFGTKYTVVAADVSAGALIIDFQTDYTMVAAITCRYVGNPDTDAEGAVVEQGDMIIAYPAVGQIQISNGDSSFTLVAGYVLDIIACRAKTD